MSPDEQNLLSGLFERIRTAASTPRDGEAEALIDRAVRAQPSAPYYLSQAVIIQEKGLEAAARHIEDLESQLRRSEEKIRSLEDGTDPAPRESHAGGFLGSLFGSSEKTQPAGSAASGPWNATPHSTYSAAQPPATGGPWDRQPQQASAGGGFLRGAMGTAAGVAGGMLLAHSLSGIFGNHMSSLGLGDATAATAPIEETVINNYYGDDAVTPAAGDATENAGQNTDDWQQADLDTGDDGFDSGDDSMNV